MKLFPIFRPAFFMGSERYKITEEEVKVLRRESNIGEGMSARQ